MCCMVVMNVGDGDFCECNTSEEYKAEPSYPDQCEFIQISLSPPRSVTCVPPHAPPTSSSPPWTPPPTPPCSSCGGNNYGPCPTSLCFNCTPHLNLSDIPPNNNQPSSTPPGTPPPLERIQEQSSNESSSNQL